MSEGRSTADGCKKSGQPDYESVEIASKPATEYTWQERRGELLQLIRQKGHPRSRGLTQAELAERYGVSQQQISKDFDRLNEHVRANLGGRRALVLDSVLQNSIIKLQEEGEHRKAAKTAIEYADWVREKKEYEELEAQVQEIKRQRDGDA